MPTRPWARGMARVPLLCAAALALTLAACAYPERNRPLETYEPHTGYRWSPVSPTDLSDTLVLVSASGGGTRAAALTMSVLQGMDQTAVSLQPSAFSVSKQPPETGNSCQR